MSDKPPILKSFLPTWPYLRKPDGGVIQPSEKLTWDCPAMLAPNPYDNLRRLFADLADKYRNQARELEADIVLSAVELYGCDIRDLHQQIHPDRTVYLVAGKPLVAVWRPSVIDGQTFKPHNWMDIEPGPTRIGMKYRLLYTPETKS